MLEFKIMKIRLAMSVLPKSCINKLDYVNVLSLSV